MRVASARSARQMPRWLAAQRCRGTASPFEDQAVLRRNEGTDKRRRRAVVLRIIRPAFAAGSVLLMESTYAAELASPLMGRLTKVN